MTQLAILADIHGNLPALEAVQQDLSQFRIDHVVVAGDTINVGPFSEQVVRRVIDEEWAVIRGNSELYLLDFGTSRAPDEWNDPSEFPMLPWLDRQLSNHSKTVIATWPDVLSLRFRDAPPIRVVHGSPRDVSEGLFSNSSDEEIKTALAGIEERVVVAGHTHLSLDRTSERWRILNPGSVGLPLDGSFAASYMLLDSNAHGWESTLRRVPFDYEPIFREFERQGFVKECGVMGRFFIEAFKTARPQDGFLRWRSVHHPNAPLSNELFDEYHAKCEWWEYTHSAYRINMGAG
jgi:predicted phosphodiesterase